MNLQLIIYFGGLICNFSEVKGRALLFTSENLQAHFKDSFHLQVSLKDENNCIEILLPKIPSHEHELVSKFITEISSNIPVMFPKLFQIPLIKEINGNIHGFSSGIRSGIIPFEGYYYRLKGCGNNYDKFPLEKVTFPKQVLYTPIDNQTQTQFYEIRGCTFENTTMHELIYTHKINKILQQINFSIANIPLGVSVLNIQFVFCCFFYF